MTTTLNLSKNDTHDVLSVTGTTAQQLCKPPPPLIQHNRCSHMLGNTVSRKLSYIMCLLLLKRLYALNNKAVTTKTMLARENKMWGPCTRYTPLLFDGNSKAGGHALTPLRGIWLLVLEIVNKICHYHSLDLKAKMNPMQYGTTYLVELTTWHSLTLGGRIRYEQVHGPLHDYMYMPSSKWNQQWLTV